MGNVATDTPRKIQCVYCEEWKREPKYGEHIILDGLGGRITIRDVCDECNAEFGKGIDRELLRQSHIALRRFFDPKVTSGEIGGAQFLETENGFFDVRLRNSGLFVVPPQVAIVGEKWTLFSATKDEPVLERSIEAFKTNDPEIHPYILDVPEHDPPRLVLGSKKHLLRARTQEAADHVRYALKKGRTAVMKPSEPYQLPEKTYIRLSTDPNMIGRCVAKMAFNWGTMVLGPRFMLGEQFRPVKAYIMGTDVQDGPAVDEHGEQGVLVDQRFVYPWFEREPIETERPSTEHAIELLDLKGELGAYVGLCGGAEYFWVRLGPLDGVDMSRLPFVILRMEDDDYLGQNMHWISHANYRRYIKAIA